MTEKTFEGFAIVELFGHNVIAGHVSEQAIGGASFVRVDVPSVDGKPGYTKFFGGAAIYAITPTDEETVKIAADKIRNRPVQEWIVPTITKLLPAPAPDDSDYEGDGLED